MMSLLVKKIIKQQSKFLLFLVIPMLLIGCGSQSKKETEDETAGDGEEIVLDEEITTMDVAMEDFERMLDELPSPTKVPVILEEVGAQFDQGILVPAAKAQDFMTTNGKAAMNLGVLSSDLGYLCAYSKTQDAINYLTATQKLSEYLGVNNAVQTSMTKRFEANLSDKDSLISIVNQSISLAKDYLYEGERFGTSALVAAGGFVEGLYISTTLIENYPADAPEAKKKEDLNGLLKTVLEQKDPLGKLVNVLKELGDDDAEVVAIRTEVSNLFDMYDLIGIEELIEAGKEDEVLENDTFKNIAAQVKKTRGIIVE
ncbi:hypothetical protein R9C00_01240 [Flammeovirgaceae bacterium SG7u.111]|nr:hypothetical protein [Flammeovirgaceae bacterium SG7u.132]WPO36072.1 hypothetical protein R9C00_01240 [Flammeovirgaceae bacterium SG7u.111]